MLSRILSSLCTTTAQNGAIHYDVGGDFKADGYNALAKDIDVNVGGDFTLASKQNSSTSSGSNRSINAGASSSGSVNGGFSTGKHSGDRDWVDNRSTLVGTESVNVNVDGTLHLAGSTIANITKDGADGGNLNISAGDITWEDLQNREKNKSSGMSFQTGISLGGKKADDTTAQAGATPEPQSSNTVDSSGQFLSDSSTIGVSKSGSEREGVSYATLGSGNISTGSGRDLAGLNRDINNMDVVLSDKITGALDGSVTIDHRLLSEEGRKEIAKQVGDLDKNLADSAIGAAQGTANLGKATWDTLGAVKDFVVTDKGLGETVSDIDRQISQMQADHEFRKQNPKQQKILDDPNASFEDKVEALEAKHEVDKKYGLADKKTEALLYMLKNDTYTDSEGKVRFRQGSYFEEGELKLLGINLTDENGLIISGRKLAEVKGHENYESKHWNQNAKTAHDGATTAGEYAGANHDWANWLTGLGGNYDGVSADQWLGANIGNKDLLNNNILYTEKDGTQTRNFHTTPDPRNIDPKDIPNINEMNDPVATGLKIAGSATAAVSAISIEGGMDWVVSRGTALATAQAFAEGLADGTIDPTDPSTYRDLLSAEYVSNIENAAVLADYIIKDPAGAAKALGDWVYAGVVEAEGEERVYNILVGIGAVLGPGNTTGKITDAIADGTKQAAKKIDNIADAARAGGKAENKTAGTGTALGNEYALVPINSPANPRHQQALTSFHPTNGGALGEWEIITVTPGFKIDRFGLPSGSYFSEPGTPSAMRALPPTSRTDIYNVYEVVKPVDLMKSYIAPAYGQTGLGIQYKAPTTAQKLEDLGFIKKSK